MRYSISVKALPGLLRDLGIIQQDTVSELEAYIRNEDLESLTEVLNDKEIYIDNITITAFKNILFRLEK